MFSGEYSLSGAKFEFQFVARLYSPELMMLSAKLDAAWQASSPPLTVTPEHVLYALALTPVFLSHTPAFRYMLARMASAAPLVTRPRFAPAPTHVAGRSTRAARSSPSMNLNTESRVSRGRGLIAMSVTTGTPPNMSISR